MQSDSVVASFSGGLDSTVLLAYLLSKGRQVEAVTVDYGQRHVREIQAARSVARDLQVDHVIVDLSGLGTLLKGSALTDDDVPVPVGEYTLEGLKATVVPNRNMLLLAVCAARAAATGASTVAYAAHAGDHAVYPDCRPEFIQAMAKAIGLCHFHPITLEAPFQGMSKTEIVSLGHGIGAPFRLTWSCYDPKQGRHCGVCSTCVERKGAFLEADVQDPTAYVA